MSQKVRFYRLMFVEYIRCECLSFVFSITCAWDVWLLDSLVWPLGRSVVPLCLSSLLASTRGRTDPNRASVLLERLCPFHSLTLGDPPKYERCPWHVLPSPLRGTWRVFGDGVRVWLRPSVSLQNTPVVSSGFPGDVRNPGPRLVIVELSGLSPTSTPRTFVILTR